MSTRWCLTSSQAWLVEGNVVAAMGYVSERSYACLAQDAPDPSAFDRGLAPIQIMVNLKAAHDALSKHDSLEGLTIGVPLPIPGLRAVPQPHQGQFVLYDVPDKMAAGFDCASRLTPGAPTKASRAYGQHYAASFRVAGPAKDTSVALLWAKEDGYWKIVSWYVAPKPDETPVPPAPPEPKVVRIKADLDPRSGGEELRGHLVDSQGLRCGVSSTCRRKATRATTSCAVLTRRRQHPSTMPAGRSAQVSNAIGQWVGTSRNLEAIVEAAEPLHPSIQRDGPAVLAHVQPHQLPCCTWRRRRVRGPRPWRGAARSPAARIRASLRHDVPVSHCRTATRPCCVCSGGRKTAPGESRRTTWSCHSGWPETTTSQPGERQKLMVVKKRGPSGPSAPSPSSLRYTE